MLPAAAGVWFASAVQMPGDVLPSLPSAILHWLSLRLCFDGSDRCDYVDPQPLQCLHVCLCHVDALVWLPRN